MGGSPEKRPYDVSYGQNRYVQASLTEKKTAKSYLFARLNTRPAYCMQYMHTCMVIFHSATLYTAMCYFIRTFQTTLTPIYTVAYVHTCMNASKHKKLTDHFIKFHKLL